MTNIKESILWPRVLKRLQANFYVISFYDIKFYISYETCVAFEKDDEMHCCENMWGISTERHLNKICADKSKRIDRRIFIRTLEEMRVGRFKGETEEYESLPF